MHRRNLSPRQQAVGRPDSGSWPMRRAARGIEMKKLRISSQLITADLPGSALGFFAVAAFAAILLHGQVAMAQLAPQRTAQKFQLPITPDMPPLEDRTWTVRVIATD